MADPPRDRHPTASTWSAGSTTRSITFTQSGDPLLDGLDLSTVAIAEADIVQAEGWVPLVAAGDVPLILLGEVDGHRVVYFTFDPVRSNLPVQVTFPVLGARIIDWLAGNRLGAEAVADAGTPIAISPPAGASAVVTTPTGDVGRPRLLGSGVRPTPSSRASTGSPTSTPMGSRVGEVLATRRYVVRRVGGLGRGPSP